MGGLVLLNYGKTRVITPKELKSFCRFPRDISRNTRFGGVCLRRYDIHITPDSESWQKYIKSLIPNYQKIHTDSSDLDVCKDLHRNDDSFKSLTSSSNIGKDSTGEICKEDLYIGTDVIKNISSWTNTEKNWIKGKDNIEKYQIQQNQHQTHVHYDSKKLNSNQSIIEIHKSKTEKTDSNICSELDSILLDIAKCEKELAKLENNPTAALKFVSDVETAGQNDGDVFNNLKLKSRPSSIPSFKQLKLPSIHHFGTKLVKSLLNTTAKNSSLDKTSTSTILSMKCEFGESSKSSFSRLSQQNSLEINTEQYKTNTENNLLNRKSSKVNIRSEYVASAFQHNIDKLISTQSRFPKHLFETNETNTTEIWTKIDSTIVRENSLVDAACQCTPRSADPVNPSNLVSYKENGFVEIETKENLCDINTNVVNKECQCTPAKEKYIVEIENKENLHDINNSVVDKECQCTPSKEKDFVEIENKENLYDINNSLVDKECQCTPAKEKDFVEIENEENCYEISSKNRLSVADTISTCTRANHVNPLKLASDFVEVEKRVNFYGLSTKNTMTLADMECQCNLNSLNDVKMIRESEDIFHKINSENCSVKDMECQSDPVHTNDENEYDIQQADLDNCISIIDIACQCPSDTSLPEYTSDEFQKPSKISVDDPDKTIFESDMDEEFQDCYSNPIDMNHKLNEVVNDSMRKKYEFEEDPQSKIYKKLKDLTLTLLETNQFNENLPINCPQYITLNVKTTNLGDYYGWQNSKGNSFNVNEDFQKIGETNQGNEDEHFQNFFHTINEKNIDDEFNLNQEAREIEETNQETEDEHLQNFGDDSHETNLYNGINLYEEIINIKEPNQEMVVEFFQNLFTSSNESNLNILEESKMEKHEVISSSICELVDDLVHAIDYHLSINQDVFRKDRENVSSGIVSSGACPSLPKESISSQTGFQTCAEEVSNKESSQTLTMISPSLPKESISSQTGFQTCAEEVSNKESSQTLTMMSVQSSTEICQYIHNNILEEINPINEAYPFRRSTEVINQNHEAVINYVEDIKEKVMNLNYTIKHVENLFTEVEENAINLDVSLSKMEDAAFIGLEQKRIADLHSHAQSNTQEVESALKLIDQLEDLFGNVNIKDPAVATSIREQVPGDNLNVLEHLKEEEKFKNYQFIEACRNGCIYEQLMQIETIQKHLINVQNVIKNIAQS